MGDLGFGLRKLGGRILVGLHRREFARFIEGCQNPRVLQNQLLEKMSRKFSASPWAEILPFRRIAESSQPMDELRRIPATDYGDYEAFINDIASGAKGSQTRGDLEIRMLALTSGTTGSSKMIPVTSASLKSVRQMWRLWGFSAFSQHPLAGAGKFLQFSSPWQKTRTPSGLFAGAMTGIATSMQPRVVRNNYIVPYEVSRVEDTEERYYVAAAFALSEENLSFAIAANPQTLLNFMAWADRSSEDLLSYIRTGKNPRAKSREHYTGPILRANPARARQLDRILTACGRFDPQRIWPRLDLVATWLGGTMGRHLPGLQQTFGDRIAFRDPGLLATEGAFTIPMRDGCGEGVIAPHHQITEFWPTRLGEFQPELFGGLVPLWELKVGDQYEVFVTGWNGLLRYRMRDVVQCTGYFVGVPMVRFLHKTRDMSSMTGEKLSAFQVSEAIKVVTRKFPELKGRQILLQAVWGSPPSYRIVMTAEVLSPELAKNVSAALDEELRLFNDEYDDRRRTRRLAQPVVVQETAKFFAQLEMEAQLKAGYVPEQRKSPVLLPLTDSGPLQSEVSIGISA